MRLDRLAVCVVLTVALVGVPRLADAQPYLVRDITTSGVGGFGWSYPIPFGPGLLFLGGDNANGFEPWITDGTFAGTRVLLDTSPGISGNNHSRPSLVAGGFAYFIVEDASFRQEVWRTDGTSAGTQRITDFPGQAEPGALAFAGGILFIVVTDPATGTELWKADANPVGASLVRDIAPGSESSSPGNLTVAGDRLFFTARTGSGSTLGQLWTSDGTSAGTVRLGDDASGPVDLRSLIAVGSHVYFSGNDFSHGDEVWRSDGTQAGTLRIVDLVPGPGSSSPDDLAAAGNTVFFAATTLATGQELWKTDGTAPGTTLVADVVPGADGSSPRNLTVAGSRVFFRASSNPSPLWSSNGTAAGTVPLGNHFSFPSELTAHGSLLYFEAEDAVAGAELWRSDGTAAGTYRVIDVQPGPLPSHPRELVSALGSLFFSATGAAGRAVWRTDGTAAGTQLVRGTGPWDYSSYPSAVGHAGQNLVFGIGYQEPSAVWLSDGTTAGTGPIGPVCEPCPGTSSARVGQRLFFNAGDSAHGYEPWVSDGTPAGTRLVSDVNPGPAHFYPYPLVAVGDRVFMNGTFDSTNSSLAVMPGAAPEPSVTLVSTMPGNANVAFKGQLFYVRSAEVGDNSELWASDGTSDGTRLVTTLEGVSHVVAAPTTLFMVAGNSSTTGRELWASDGTPSGTRLVRDICPGTCGGLSGPFMDRMAVVGDTLYFFADDGIHGAEFWKSDGTLAGTVMVRDVRPGLSSSDPISPTGLDGLLYFLADDGVSGRELWRSDGTDAGTHRVTDIHPGPGWSFAEFSDELYAAAGRLYFAAHTDATGLELWRSDGTAPGTTLVGDIAPGVSSSAPSHFARAGGRLYFDAHDGATGFELWALALGPTASVGDAVVLEPDSGTVTAAFEVRVDGTLSTPETVSYSVAAGTASAGSDFVPVSGVLTFLPGGPAAQIVNVPILGDQVQEPDESFQVRLANGLGLSIDRSRGDGVILDDDAVHVAVAHAEVVEGNVGTRTMGFTATLTTENLAASTIPTTVEFDTRDASATAGTDFDAAAGVVTFPAGTPSGSTRTIDVVVRGDLHDEGDEAFSLQLRPLSVADIVGARGIIRDDDGTSSAPIQGVQHGSVVSADLAPLPGGTADTDWYFMGSEADASYEVVADGVSGAVGPLHLDRLAADDATVLEQGVAVGTGSARSLRWMTGPTAVGDRIRVRSGGCGSGCTIADVYRLRVYETTYSISRFNAVNGLATFVILQNRTGSPIHADVKFWLQFAGTQQTVPVTIPAHGSQVVPAPASVGGVTIVHDGPYGALAGKAAIVDPIVGASYDVPMEPRRR